MYYKLELQLQAALPKRKRMVKPRYFWWKMWLSGNCHYFVRYSRNKKKFHATMTKRQKRGRAE